ncbi:SH3 domain-containing protein [Sulfitobacter sp.]|uniref:SH3 domain-containing protein n=1 Tax=Sulfitobacter sp. TaxID=1903071 RepID=UPI003EF14857
MKTFILLTFGFLAFAFYEMSGGSDFAPASARMAEADTPKSEKVAQAETQAPAAAVTANAGSIAKISTTPSVTRVALNLTNVADTQDAATAPTAEIIDSADTPEIILPSLIATTNTNGSALEGDVRKVSGNRVNVRGGPSTNYGVVSKLARGVEVRILEDNGDGWVRMQPLDGGEAGWMADFLLTSG